MPGARCRISILVWMVHLSSVPLVTQAQTGSGTATTTGISRDFNPATSLNSLFLGSGFSNLNITEQGRTALHESGVRFQEMEIQFTSTIDPFSKADVIIAFADGVFGVEEAIVSTTALPFGLGLRAGRMFVPIGVENTLHTHQLPFVQRSLIGSTLFEESLADFGAELSYLLPLPFFVDVRGAVYNGAQEVFGAQGDWDLAYLGGFSGLWDLGESSTLAWETGFLAGQNDLGEATWTQVLSTGLTLKWRPVRHTIYKSFVVAGEFLYGEAEGSLAEESPVLSTNRGGYAYLQYQFSRRWWLQGRYDLSSSSGSNSNAWRTSALLSFVPSEFQALRIQVSQVDRPDDTFTEFFLQYNFTIGSHPAHKY